MSRRSISRQRAAGRWSSKKLSPGLKIPMFDVLFPGINMYGEPTYRKLRNTAFIVQCHWYRAVSLSTSNSVDDLDHSRPGRPMPNKSHGVAGGNVEKAVIICMQSESDGKRPGRISLRFEHKIELSD